MATLIPRGDKLTLIAVLGAGVVVGISGLYLYYKFNRCLNREISNLAASVDSLKREIELLKQRDCVDSGTMKPIKQRKTRSRLASNDAAGYYTANPSSGDEADEYYDFSDDENENAIDTLDTSWASLNGSSSSKVSFDELDKLLDGDDVERKEVHEKLRVMKDEYANSADYLWRMARSCYDMAVIAGSCGESAKKKDLIMEGGRLSAVAIAMREDVADIHKWYAITLGSCGDYLGVQEKIKNAFIFKEHVETAIKLSPNDHSLYHLLGRWCYEVSLMTWVERKLASAIFAAPPTSSFEEAKTNFLKAEEVKPNQWKENMLFVAKSFIGLGEYAQAVEWLDKATKLPNLRKDDEVAQKEIDELKHKYRKYRIAKK